MAKPSKNGDLKEHWICEFCHTPHAGKDPPDACTKCANQYFENLHDMVTRGFAAPAEALD